VTRRTRWAGKNLHPAWGNTSSLIAAKAAKGQELLKEPR